jgi:hypothetical protein
MAKNREMLKEAIAEAKAVKEMAIANAKAALEEAFTPQLKSMLSLKLQEMEEMDEMEDKEMYEMEDKEDMNEKKENMMEVDLEELLAELELEEDEVEENLYEAEEGEEEGEATEDVDLSDEEIKDMIEDVLAQMIKDGEIEAGPNFEAEEGEEEASEEEASEEDEEEVNLEELLKEIEEMETKEMETEAMEAGIPSEAAVKAAADKLAAAVKSGEISQEDFQAFLQAGREEAKDDMATLSEAEGEDIKTMIKNDIKDLERDRRIGKIASIVGIGTGILGLVALGLGFGADAAAVNAAKAFEVVKVAPEVLIGLASLAGGAFAGIKGADKAYKAKMGIASKEYQLKKMDEELTEAYSTIKSLRSELNEINLLNAKLLYTNKIFKAKNLNENQKVKVLSSFDKAKNVGEVKMVYETLNEGIKVAKTTIKENLGRASKSTVTPTAKQPIVESNDVFKRMQKLAGLI